MPEQINSIKPPIGFRDFDEDGDVRIYTNGILPHWRQDGCTYFVTFRQADSLPAPVLRELEHDRKQWLINHGIDPADKFWKKQFAKLLANVKREYERLVGVRLDKFLDAGHGSCVLSAPEISKLVANALDFFHLTRVETGDFVVMPNHVHVLMTPMHGFELEDILQAIKSYTSNQINQRLGRTGTFWQRESYDHIVRDGEQLRAFQKYIEYNPVKANLGVERFEHQAASYFDAMQL